MRRLLVLVLFALLVAWPAAAKNTAKIVYGPTALTQNDGSTVLAFFPTPTNSAYLVITAASEVGTGSLSLTAAIDHATASDTTICTTTAVTANGHWTVLLGSNMTAAEGVDQVCKMPLGATVRIIGTIADDSGDPGDGFTVTVEWHQLDQIAN